ncbi:hypothetical protein GTP69_00290 [Duganella sp. CY42W]|uniref:Uncharacterized protein n=2 Tax=Duganella levis TaxID=2692169 RepID=A0ABW9VT94_9BURK|nr:hypothetical protein [Duganella levis]
MELAIDGHFILRTSSQESVVRELHMHGARELTIDDQFVTELPTTLKALRLAAEIQFDELLAALKLVAACASIEELAPVAKPERRAIPRAEIAQLRPAR